MIPPRIESRTLSLIPISPETSWEEVCNLHKCASVIKDSFFRDGYAEFQPEAQSSWMMMDREHNILLGFAGLVRQNNETHLRLRTEKMYWKNGVSREAALAILGYAFRENSSEAVYVEMDKDKTYLRKFVENLGFAKIEEAGSRLKMRITPDEKDH